MSQAPEPVVREPQERESREFSALLPVILYVAAILFAFGYEIFSFNLTIDEEVTALFTRAERVTGSVAEGRWTMATLTGLMPAMVVPVVSTAIGVGLTSICWWVLARRFLGMSPWVATLACSVAGTFPVLAFLFSFSSIAWVIGIGSALSLGFIAGVSSPVLRYRILGIIAGASAVGVYDSFIVVIAVFVLAVAVRRGTVRFLLEGVVAAIAVLVLSRLIGLLYSLVLNIPLGTYTSSFIDIPGLIADPAGRLSSAASDVASTFLLSSERFGLTSPTLAVFTVLLLAAAVASLVLGRGNPGNLAVRVIALVLVALAPFLVEAAAFAVVMRSMMYLPAVILAFASIAFAHDWRPAVSVRKVAIVAFTALTIATVMANSVIVNRLFSTAATTYSLDQQLAFQIGQQKDLLLNGDQSRDLPIVVAGLHGWPEGTFTSVRETIGLSFFELNENRSAAFLLDHGVIVHQADEAERKRVADALDDMPIYPAEGWIALDHGVLLIKFADAP